jgi:hypothetical protein
MPGAKIPARTKTKETGVQRAETGAKKGNNNHKIAALIDKEMKEPVMALEPTKPRRMKMWAMEKHNAA